MKGRDRNLLVAITVVSFCVGFNFVDHNYKYYSEIVTFLSILIGFQVTSISILFNSKILRNLYNSKNNLYKTDLHKLSAYFKYSINLEIFFILLILTLKDYWIISLVGYNICFTKSILVFPILAGSIYCFYKVSNELFTIFVLPRNE